MEFYKLPDSMSCEALRDKFNAFIARYKDNTNKYDLYNVLDELYELSDRQWHTYELLENNVKQQIENFIFSILDIENTVIMDSVLSIIPLLGLTNLFLYITEKKEFIANKEVKKLIDDAEKEYEASVENPYSGM